MPDPVSLSSTPVNIVAASSLAVGTKYVIQAHTAGHSNLGTMALDTPVYLYEGTATPADENDLDTMLAHFEKMVIEPVTGMGIWVWTPTGRQSGRLLIARGV